MTHKHWCGVTGHEWECEGAALRVFNGDTEPSVCMCALHRVSFEVGDHSQCEMEILACEEHREQELRAMGYEPGEVPPKPSSADAEVPSIFKDADGNRIAGFCLWCGKGFYSMDEVYDHNVDNMANCPVFQELKDEHCGPPVLQHTFEQAELPDGEPEGKEQDRHGREEEK